MAGDISPGSWSREGVRREEWNAAMVDRGYSPNFYYFGRSYQLALPGVV